MSTAVALNFPLCLLSYPGSTHERLDTTISYAIVDYAVKLENIAPCDEEKREDIIEEELGSVPEDDFPSDCNRDDDFHRRIMVSVRRKGVRLGTMERTIQQYDGAKQYAAAYQKRFGGDAYVQVNKEVCFKVRDGRFDYNLFAVICAVKSAIGKTSKFKPVTKAQIRARINGYKSPEILDAMESENRNIIDLSPKQIERLRDKAAQLNFFRFFTYKRRQTYYSTRLDDRELIKAVYESKNYASEKKIAKLRAEFDAEQIQRDHREYQSTLLQGIQAVRT